MLTYLCNKAVVIAVVSYYGAKYAGDGAKELVSKRVGIC